MYIDLVWSVSIFISFLFLVFFYYRLVIIDDSISSVEVFIVVFILLLSSFIGFVVSIRFILSLFIGG